MQSVDELTQSILAIYAFYGFDTTSRLHSAGSRTLLRNFLKNKVFRNLLRIFSLSSSDRKDILLAGEKILLLLLGDKKEKALDVLRIYKYYEKIIGQTRYLVKVEVLEPTSDAEQQDVIQIYYQIQERGNALDSLK